MVNSRFFFLCLLFGLIGIGTVYAACVNPEENLKISTAGTTIFCPGTFYLNDTDKNGVINITVSDVVIQCNNTIFDGILAPNSRAIRISNAVDDIIIRGCTFKDYHQAIRDYPLSLTSRSNHTIKDNKFITNNNTGIVASTKGLSIINNTFTCTGLGTYISKQAIYITSGGTTANTIIENNSITNGCTEGISINWGNDNTLIKGNRINNTDIGIHIVDTSDVIITKNKLFNQTRNQDNYDVGILLRDRNYPADKITKNITIINNTFEKWGTSAVVMIGAKQVNITKNDFRKEISAANMGKFAALDAGEYPCVIKAVQLYKSYVGSAEEKNQWNISNLQNFTSTNISIKHNQMNTSSNCYIQLQGAKLVSTDLTNYKYFAFTAPDWLLNKTEFYVPNTFTKMQKYNGGTSNTAYFNLNSLNVRKLLNYTINSTMVTFFNLNKTTSLKLYNLTRNCPYCTVYNKTGSAVLQYGGTDTFTANMGKNQQYWVGYYPPSITSVVLNSTYGNTARDFDNLTAYPQGLNCNGLNCSYNYKWYKNGVLNATRWIDDKSTIQIYPFDNNSYDYKLANNPVNKGAIRTPNGKIGGAYTFNGIDQYLNGTTYSIKDKINFTFAAWVYIASGGENQYIYDVITEAGTNDPILSMGILTTNRFQAQFRDLAGNIQSRVSSVVLSNKTWYHVAATINRAIGNITVYVNGQKSGTATIVAGNITNTIPVYIGARNSRGTPGSYFNGTIDEIIVSNKTFSLDEIRALYSAGNPTKPLFIQTPKYKDYYKYEFTPCDYLSCGSALNSSLYNISCQIVYDNWIPQGTVTSCNQVYSIADAGKDGVIKLRKNNTIFDCNGADFLGSYSNASIGITIGYAKNVTLKNCNITKYNYGVSVYLASNITVMGNYVSLCNFTQISASDTTGRQYFRVENNTILKAGNNINSIGIQISGYKNSVVKNNKILGLADRAIEVKYDSDNTNITLNNISYCDRSIFVKDSENILIYKNYISNTTKSYDSYGLGIHIYHTVSYTNYLTRWVKILNNTMTKLVTTGVLIQGAINVSIDGDSYSFLPFNNQKTMSLGNEPPTSIIVSPLFKTFVGDATETTSDRYNKIHNYSSTNITIKRIRFDNNALAILKAHDVTNLKTDFTDYWYRALRVDSIMYGKIEYYINNSVKELKTMYYLPSSWRNSTILTESYKGSYPRLYGLHPYNYSVNKTMMRFKNINNTLTYNMSFFNLSSPFDDIFNQSNQKVIKYNAVSWSGSVGPGQEVRVGDYVLTLDSVLLNSSNGGKATTIHNLTAYPNLQGEEGINTTYTYKWYNDTQLQATTFVSTASPVSYYIFKYDSYDYYGTHNITLYNTTRLSNTLIFDGINDWAAIPSLVGKNYSKYSINLWVNHKTKNDYQMLIADGQQVLGSPKIQLDISSSDTTHFSIGDGATTTSTSSNKISANKWYMLTLVFNGTNLMLYINGTKTKTSANVLVGAKNKLISNNLVLGRAQSSSTDYDYNGSMANIGIYNSTLTDAQVKQLYYGGFVDGQLNQQYTVSSRTYKVEVTPINYLEIGNSINSSTLRIDDTKPTFSAYKNYSTNWRRYTNFTANVSIYDPDTVSWVIYETNATSDGNWTNTTKLGSGTTYKASFAKNLTLQNNQWGGWRYYSNDTQNSTLTKSSTYTFEVLGWQNGTVCSTNLDCETELCVDGYCCNSACTGTCYTCDGAYTGGSNGFCAPIKINLDPYSECIADDTFTGVCDGGGACQKHTSPGAPAGGGGSGTSSLSCLTGYVLNGTKCIKVQPPTVTNEVVEDVNAVLDTSTNIVDSALGFVTEIIDTLKEGANTLAINSEQTLDITEKGAVVDIMNWLSKVWDWTVQKTQNLWELTKNVLPDKQTLSVRSAPSSTTKVTNTANSAENSAKSESSPVWKYFDIPTWTIVLMCLGLLYLLVTGQLILVIYYWWITLLVLGLIAAYIVGWLPI